MYYCVLMLKLTKAKKRKFYSFTQYIQLLSACMHFNEAKVKVHNAKCSKICWLTYMLNFVDR